MYHMDATFDTRFFTPNPNRHDLTGLRFAQHTGKPRGALIIVHGAGLDFQKENNSPKSKE